MTTNSYITNRKPSTLKRLLNLLGVIELHAKVNCWFCGQDSFLLPGSRNTVDQWVCPLCDNYNARDSVRHKKTSPVNKVSYSSIRMEKSWILLRTKQELSQRLTVNVVGTFSTRVRYIYSPLISLVTQLIKPNEIQAICSGCQKNQLLIYDIMSNYIPEETVSVKPENDESKY